MLNPGLKAGAFDASSIAEISFMSETPPLPGRVLPGLLEPAMLLFRNAPPPWRPAGVEADVGRIGFCNPELPGLMIGSWSAD